MKTVVSLDLDIIMAPYCGVYNHAVRDKDDRFFNWKEIESKYNVLDFKANKPIINKILELINDCSNKVPTIYVGYDHSSILDAINREFVELDSKINLYNFDYHHDICYSDADKDRVVLQGLPSCGSWVGFLNANNCINNYYWYCGTGSEFDKKNLVAGKNECVPSSMVINNIELEEIPNLNPDLFYITTSPPWIPPHEDKNIKSIINTLDKNKIFTLEGPYAINNDRKQFLNRMINNEQYTTERFN